MVVSGFSTGKPLGADVLRWCCDSLLPPFGTTDEIEPITGVVGQDDAIEALRYGLEVFAPGQNIYVRGIAGTGRKSLVRQLLEDISPGCPLAEDRCYVHNFAQPGRPRLITLPRGSGRDFSGGVDRLIEFVEEELAQVLNAESVRARRAALDKSAQQSMRELGAPFEEELRANGLALVTRAVSGGVQTDILPVVDGEAVPLQQLEALGTQGKIEPETIERVRERIGAFALNSRNLATRLAKSDRTIGRSCVRCWSPRPAALSATTSMRSSPRSTCRRCATSSPTWSPIWCKGSVPSTRSRPRPADIG